MWKCWLLLALTGSLFASEDPRQALIASIKSDTVFEDPILAAIQAQDGLDDAGATAVRTKLQAMLDSIQLPAKVASKKGKRKAKALLEALNDKVSMSEMELPLSAMVANGEAGPLGHALLLSVLAERDGLGAGDLKSLSDKADAYLTGGEARTLAEMTSAYLTQSAMNLGVDSGMAAYAMLRVSKTLDDDSTFGVDTIDRLLFNKALEQYQAEKFELAGYLGAGGAERFPNLEQYGALCYNAGVMLMKSANDMAIRQKVRPLLQYLAPHTGENKETFLKGIDTLAYNDAIDLYNQGEARAALDLLLDMENPPEPEQYQMVIRDSYTLLIEQAVDAGEDHTALLEELKNLDAGRAKEITTRLDQLKIKALDEAGDYASALEAAKQGLDGEYGRQNYLSVMVRYIKQFHESGNYETALDVLSRVPPSLQSDQEVMDLRFNTYNNWLASLPSRAFEQHHPVYQRLFADRSLNLTAEDRDAFMNNWGNQVFFKTESMIADQKFKEADAFLKKHEGRFTGHKALTDIRGNLNKILARGGD